MHRTALAIALVAACCVASRVWAEAAAGEAAPVAVAATAEDTGGSQPPEQLAAGPAAGRDFADDTQAAPPRRGAGPRDPERMKAFRERLEKMSPEERQQALERFRNRRPPGGPGRGPGGPDPERMKAFRERLEKMTPEERDRFRRRFTARRGPTPRPGEDARASGDASPRDHAPRNGASDGPRWRHPRGPAPFDRHGPPAWAHRHHGPHQFAHHGGRHHHPLHEFAHRGGHRGPHQFAHQFPGRRHGDRHQFARHGGYQHGPHQFAHHGWGGWRHDGAHRGHAPGHAAGREQFARRAHHRGHHGHPEFARRPPDGERGGPRYATHHGPRPEAHRFAHRGAGGPHEFAARGPGGRWHGPPPRRADPAAGPDRAGGAMADRVSALERKMDQLIHLISDLKKKQ